MTEQNLMYLTNNNDEVYVVHGGKILNPGAIGHLRNNAIVHVVDKMPGGGKKGSDRSSTEADMFFELMGRSCKTGEIGWDEDFFQQMFKFDDDAMQEMMKKLRNRIQVSTGTNPEPAFETLYRNASRQ